MTVRSFGRTGFLLLALACAQAQAASADGTLSLRADAWSGDRDLNERSGLAAASAWGRGKLTLDGDTGQVVANGWLRTPQGDADRTAQLRELYWRKNLGEIDLRVGRQMPAWGRADGLNPTDNLSPRDFRLLAPDDGDLRLGNDGVQLGLPAPAGSLTLLWFARAASHRIPLEAQPGVVFREERSGTDQWALKWDFNTASSIDGSLSWFSGSDPMPDLVPGSLSLSGLEVVLRNQRLRVLGADMSTTRDGVVWRAEAALTRTASRGAGDFEHKKPQLWVVAGGEWSFADATTLGVQATALRVFHHGDPRELLAPGPLQQLAVRQLATRGQAEREQAGVVVRLARRVWNDTLLLEANGVALAPLGHGQVHGLARLRIEYALDDRWRLHAGADHYAGPQDSSFGQLHRNGLAYVQLRRSL